VLDRVIDRGDRVADIAFALLVERLQHDQVRTGSNSAARAVRIMPVACDDPGDVRSVSVAVVWLRAKIDEVGEMHDPSCAEIVVRTRNAGIDRRDPDPRTVEAELLADPPGADCRGGPLERSMDAPVQADGANGRQRCERIDR
jgi:hypothetical protein